MSDGRSISYRFNQRALEQQAQDLVRRVRQIAQARKSMESSARRLRTSVSARFQVSQSKLRAGLGSFRSRFGG